MLDISQLSPEQIQVIEQYKKLYAKVGELKIRIEILRDELSNSISELTELRAKEHELFNNIENENNG
jgi:hypothetical protein